MGWPVTTQCKQKQPPGGFKSDPWAAELGLTSQPNTQVPPFTQKHNSRKHQKIYIYFFFLRFLKKKNNNTVFKPAAEEQLSHNAVFLAQIRRACVFAKGLGANMGAHRDWLTTPGLLPST